MIVPKRTRRGVGLPELPLAAREVRGNLMVTDDQVTAWFRMGAQPWQWRGDDYRNRHLRSAQTTWASLAGHDVHMRVTSRPYPAHRWAQAMLDITPHPADAGAFGTYLTRTQRHLRTSSQADGEVYVGISVGTDRRTADRLAATLRRGRLSERERVRLQQQVDEITEIVAMPGMGARPVRQDELVWLMHRSIGLGLPEPVDLSVPSGTLDSEVLDGLHDSVDVDPRPFKRTVEIAGHPHRNGYADDGTGQARPVTRHVAVLSLGRMESFTVPELHDPWVAFAERLPFAVEWSLRFRVVDGITAADEMKKRLDAVDDQTEQYRTHRIPLPPRLTRLRETATTVRDTMEEGTAVVAARFDGYFDVAVWGRTETEALDNARSLRNLYKPVNVTVEHPPGQHGLYRGFIPGEQRSTTAHRHRGEVAYLAAAVPHLASRVGDRRGGYLGWTNSTSRRACMYDPHFGIEVRERSGLTPVVGGLGAGKALALDTPLPTPAGWTTMGRVEVGDRLLGADGRPTEVLAATGTMVGRPCYRVEFSDGTSVVADADHQWSTRSRAEWKVEDYRRRRRDQLAVQAPPVVGDGLCGCGCGQATRVMERWNTGLRPGDSRRFLKGHSRRGEAATAWTPVPDVVRTTREIARSLTFGPSSQSNHAVRLAAPLSLPDADVPLDPYVLGVWLGDGDSAGNGFTCFDQEIVSEIERRGYVARPLATPGRYGLGMPRRDACSTQGCPRPPRGHTAWCDSCRQRNEPRPGRFKNVLERVGVLGRKHVPAVYLRGSEQQRRDLLAGLLDTDGHANAKGGVEFGVTHKALADGAIELIRSLGYKPTMTTKAVRGRSEESSTCYTVRFTTSDKVFRLSRKNECLNAATRATNDWRYITAVVPVESVAVRCVEVAAADHLYLAGRAMVPTHNSTLMGSVAYLTALRGIPTTILDPSGPLARLCYMPELAGRARHVDLLKSAPGTLAPYTAIPTPTREQVAEDERLTGMAGPAYDELFAELFADAVHQAERTRMTLAIDVLRLLLPPAYRDARGPMNIVRDAVRTVGGQYTASLGSVLNTIKADPRDTDHEIYKLLQDMSESPQSRLFFGSGYMAERAAGPAPDEVLLVLTMAGLSLPDEKIPEANWSEQERIAVPLLTLAAHYATRRIYSRSMRERKLVAMDEAHFLRGIPTGRALVDRLARDSRKWTTRVMVATQKCADLDQLSARGLVRELFLGRIEDADEARAALTLAGIPTGVGYEAQLADLSPDDPTLQDEDGAGYREFVMRDVDGNVERVRIDLEHQPELFAVLRTRRRTDPTQEAPTPLETGLGDGLDPVVVDGLDGLDDGLGDDLGGVEVPAGRGAHRRTGASAAPRADHWTTA
jgi:hypothetical protein